MRSVFFREILLGFSLVVTVSVLHFSSIHHIPLCFKKYLRTCDDVMSDEVMSDE